MAAAAGLQMAGKFGPDLALVAFTMADMNGAAVAKALKAKAQAPIVVVISRDHSSAQLTSLLNHLRNR